MLSAKHGGYMSKINVADTAIKYAAFLKEVEALSGNALLDKKLEHDGMPPAKEGERDLRLQQSLCLEAALVAEYGLGQWQKPLDQRRSNPDT